MLFFYFFKIAHHANPGAESSFAGPSSYISAHIFICICILLNHLLNLYAQENY